MKKVFKTFLIICFQIKKSTLAKIFLVSRKKYLNNVTGIKTLLYLLYKTRNSVLKDQLPYKSGGALSTMNLNKKHIHLKKLHLVLI